MHKQNPRIDGLTKLHQKHNSKIGQTVTIEVIPNEPATVHVRFEDEIVGLSEPNLESTTEAKENDALFITASLESMLEDFITNNLSALEPSLQLFKDEDGIPGRQYTTEVGTIDLLCVDGKNNFVVIELKRGRESDKVVGQISRYIGWVKAKLADNSRDVRGIVIIHKPTEKYPKDNKLEYAISANSRLELRYYEINLKFFERGKVFS